MKKIIEYIRNNIKKSHLILICLGLSFILVGYLSWSLYFSKYYQFNKNEKALKEAVLNYYEYHSIYLPKEGSVKTITLEELYKENRVEELKVPKSDRLCDTDSWVKVYNDNGNYIYYTYLKCGKYESNTDHTGPIITLNGDSTIYVSLNHEYEEPGVKNVVDDKDGNIDIDKVTIDSSKVNTKKVGKYNVTYTVRDTLNNETKVNRLVVVARNLTTVVQDTTGESGYYRGDVNNNYVLFSGMMFRIINVNSDGTVRLISNENLNNLRADHENYENSNIDTYLTNEYLNIIHDKSYLVDSEYCVGNITSRNDVTGACSTKITRKVGLLSYQEFLNTLVENKGYLCTNYNYALSNKVTGNILTVSGDKNCTSIVNNEVLPAIRPVITLKSNLLILTGDGTSKNPYKLDDYNYGKQQDKINTRIIGEYVNYSGNIYRIMGIDNDKNVKMIATDIMHIGNTNRLLLLNVPEIEQYRFNSKEQNNPGYIMNNDYIDYINDTYLVKTKYQVPVNVALKKYSEYDKDFSGEAKLILPATYDLFASIQTNGSTGLYLYLDASSENKKVFYINPINGRVFEDTANKFGKYALKMIITVKGDLLIKSGKGTLQSPYYIK